MAFPTNVLALASAIGSQFLATAWGGTVGMAAGLNQILADLIAVETKLGTGTSTATAGKVLGADGTGTSSWRQIVSADITDGTIVAADISASAAIAATQLAAGAASSVLIGGASNSFSTTPAVSAININTTGATSGQVKTSAEVLAGAGLFASGQATYGTTVQTTGSLANLSSLTFGAGFAWLYIINNSTGAMCSVECQGALNTVLQHSAAATGFTINSDSGANIAIYHNGSAYAVKNRSGGAVAITVIKVGS